MRQLQLTFIYGILIQILALALAQRVAPGVPPQQYQPPQYQPQQQPQQHQQQQQQYQQYQQQPIQQQQYQQVPQQQHQPHGHVQNAPQQQQQQQQQHHQQLPQQNHQPHGHAHGSAVLTGDVQQERAHIAEHLDVPIDTSKMSEQELQFHYFKMHDADNNNKLDGSELIKSLIHWHEQGSKEKQNNPEQQQIEDKVFTDEELTSLIDPILKMDDTSNDGYIDYPEFIRAQQKAAGNQQQNQQQQN